MKHSGQLRFEDVGPWTEIKLEIVKKYAAAYSQILSRQKNPSLYHVYIDGFAGAGVSISRASDEFVLGSPLNALNVKPPFREFHLIDLDGDKVRALKQMVGNRKDVRIYQGDCNTVLRDKVFPKVRFEHRRRGLCLLDPYGLHLNWQVIKMAGQMRTIEVFLNFPIMDINRNVLRRNRQRVPNGQVKRMNAYWGDDSWEPIAYTTTPTLFGDEYEKTRNEDVVRAFRKRLKTVAGFENVPDPLPMRNSKGATVYYLFFASHKRVAQHIVTDIFNKYRERER